MPRRLFTPHLPFALPSPIESTACLFLPGVLKLDREYYPSTSFFLLEA